MFFAVGYLVPVRGHGHWMCVGFCNWNNDVERDGGFLKHRSSNEIYVEGVGVAKQCQKGGFDSSMQINHEAGNPVSYIWHSLG